VTSPGSIVVAVEFQSVSRSSYSVLEVEALDELQRTKNYLGSDEMLLVRLGDVLGEFSND
jgi:hypothetical protein